MIIKSHTIHTPTLMYVDDGKHPSLTCATSAGKVLIHNPREHNDDGTPKLNYLNINKKITALEAGAFNAEDKRDTLLIGTPTNLLAFDVENNADLFYAVRSSCVFCIFINGKEFESSCLICKL